jgi:hypothetical protein
LTFDIGNYTVYEIMDMFKLDSASCTVREADACASSLMTALADYPDAPKFHSSDARENQGNLFRTGLNPTIKPLSLKTATTIRMNRRSTSANNTLNINYSTPPSNSDVFNRESEVNDGGYAKRNIAPVINAYNYKFPTGTINPIERRVIKRLLSMDTLFRVNYNASSSTNASWVLPYPVETWSP